MENRLLKLLDGLHVQQAGAVWMGRREGELKEASKTEDYMEWGERWKFTTILQSKHLSDGNHLIYLSFITGSDFCNLQKPCYLYFKLQSQSFKLIIALLLPDLYPQRVKAELLSSSHMQTSNSRPQSLGLTQGCVRNEIKHQQ